MRTIWMICWLCVGWLSQAGAQSVPGMGTFDLNRDLDEQLPPLDSLMIVARDSSPMVLKFDAISRAEKEKITLAKKTWGNHLQAFTNVSGGNQGLLISGTTASESTTVTNGIRYGLNLSVPISEFLTRNNRIKLATAEFEAAEWQRKEAERLVELEIVNLYQKMLLAHRLVQNTRSFAEKAALNEQLAEKQFRENSTRLADYTRIAEIKALADSRYFDALTQFMDAYQKLEVLLGVPLVSLKR